MIQWRVLLFWCWSWNWTIAKGIERYLYDNSRIIFNNGYFNGESYSFYGIDKMRYFLEESSKYFHCEWIGLFLIKNISFSIKFNILLYGDEKSILNQIYFISLTFPLESESEKSPLTKLYQYFWASHRFEGFRCKT
jgi:hypothetical protein